MHLLWFLLYILISYADSQGISIKSSPTYGIQIENYVNSYEIDPFESSIIFGMKRTESFIPPSCGKKAAPCDVNTKYRRFDGSCNNLDQPEWGLPNSTYDRILPPQYGNSVRSPRISADGFNPLPNARRIRVEAFPIEEVDNHIWNINAMQWGQFMAHDMSLLKEPEIPFKCCTPDGRYKRRSSRFCYPIKISPLDPTMGKAGIRCMNFTRTMTDKDLGCGSPNNPAQQINVVTSWLDLSNVYGLNDNMANSLRTFTNGQMATEVRNGHIFLPRELNLKDFCRCNGENENVCYKTGDSRSNQNPQLTILQTIFVREHNRIARELSSINPHWNDERLFQETRRILIAVFQKISYYDWLFIFLGRQNLFDKKIMYNTTGFVNDYNPTVNPKILNEHAHGAFRFFHTHIVGNLKLMNLNRQSESTISLSDWFNRPEVLENNANNIEKLTVGMVTQNIEETDNKLVKEIADQLFSCGKQFGLDLKAFDIQRDRDHGLAYYNDYRKHCGLTEAQSFDDYKDLIPADKVEILKTIYGSYKDVELTVGGSLEKLVDDAQVGPTFRCILNEQFLKTRVSDRFWFENESSGFTLNQLLEIRKATVSRLYCDNGDGITSMQPFGFTLFFPFNQLKPCAEIPSMNLMQWKE